MYDKFTRKINFNRLLQMLMTVFGICMRTHLVFDNWVIVQQIIKYNDSIKINKNILFQLMIHFQQFSTYLNKINFNGILMKNKLNNSHKISKYFGKYYYNKFNCNVNFYQLKDCLLYFIHSYYSLTLVKWFNEIS